MRASEAWIKPHLQNLSAADGMHPHPRPCGLEKIGDYRLGSPGIGGKGDA